MSTTRWKARGAKRTFGSSASRGTPPRRTRTSIGGSASPPPTPGRHLFTSGRFRRTTGRSTSSVTFELGDFNRQWLVYAADPRVATTIVDQQMMSWLMTSHPQWDYELTDGWLMVMREDLRASPSQYELEPVLEALLAFREHIPRAADSLFGSKDTT